MSTIDILTYYGCVKEVYEGRGADGGGGGGGHDLVYGKVIPNMKNKRLAA